MVPALPELEHGSRAGVLQRRPYGGDHLLARPNEPRSNPHVIARTSSMAYKQTVRENRRADREGTPRQLPPGEQRPPRLDPCSYRRAPHRVEDQTQVWGATYDRAPPDDFLGLQDEIGTAIANQIMSKLSSPAPLEVGARKAPDPQAYDLYLRGRFYGHQLAPPFLLKAIECFQAAIAKDSSYALPYAGIVESHVNFLIAADAPPQEHWEKARLRPRKAWPSVPISPTCMRPRPI